MKLYVAVFCFAFIYKQHVRFIINTFENYEGIDTL